MHRPAPNLGLTHTCRIAPASCFTWPAFKHTACEIRTWLHEHMTPHYYSCVQCAFQYRWCLALLYSWMRCWIPGGFAGKILSEVTVDGFRWRISFPNLGCWLLPWSFPKLACTIDRERDLCCFLRKEKQKSTFLNPFTLLPSSIRKRKLSFNISGMISIPGQKMFLIYWWESLKGNKKCCNFPGFTNVLDNAICSLLRYNYREIRFNCWICALGLAL